MTIDIFSSAEQVLLDAWFRSAPIDGEVLCRLQAAGLDHDCDPYTRLDAWVGAFAVAEIQTRLPNCGICRTDGVVLNREIRATPARKVTGMIRHLFTINWADSAPGISWPVAYNLVWVPGFDRFVVTSSADGTDAFGYCDFALGHLGPDVDWRQAVRDILVRDWRNAYASWDQSPWAYLFDSGVIPLLPAYLEGEAVREYMARTDEFSLRRMARWRAQMDIEFPMLDCPDLGFIPAGKPPART